MPDRACCARFQTASRNRARILNKHGSEVRPDELEPILIGPERRTCEDFSAANKERLSLEAERANSITFHDKLDEAREEAADGKISGERLEELEADLAKLSPPQVHDHLPWQSQEPDMSETKLAAPVMAPTLSGPGI